MIRATQNQFTYEEGLERNQKNENIHVKMAGVTRML